MAEDEKRSLFKCAREGCPNTTTAKDQSITVDGQKRPVCREHYLEYQLEQSALELRQAQRELQQERRKVEVKDEDYTALGRVVTTMDQKINTFFDWWQAEAQKVRERDHALGTVRRDYQGAIDRLEATIVEKNARILELEDVANANAARVAEQTSRIEGLETRLRGTEGLAAERGRQIETLQARIEEQQRATDSNVAEAERLRKREQEKSDLVVLLQRRIRERDSLIEIKDMRIREQDEKAASLEQELEARDSTAEALRETIVEKDAKIVELEETIAQLEARLKGREGQIAGLQDHLEEKVQEVGDYKTRLDDASSRLGSYEAAVANLRQQLQHCQIVSSERWAEARKLEQELEAYKHEARIRQERDEENEKLADRWRQVAAALKDTFAEDEENT